MGKNASPQTILIERQLKLQQALNQAMPTSTVLFCYHHIMRTLKNQYAFLEKERPEEFKMITTLPILETKVVLDEQLAKVEKISYQNDYHRLII